VNYSARRFNDLKVKNELLTRELKRRLDELDEQKNLYERLAAMKNVSYGLLILCLIILACW
jgi:hypothetical protein